MYPGPVPFGGESPDLLQRKGDPRRPICCSFRDLRRVYGMPPRAANSLQTGLGRLQALSCCPTVLFL
jgi:hypothetical protein